MAVAGVIGVLLAAANIPMMEQFYADKVEASKVYTNVKIGVGSTLANESNFSTGGHKPNIALWGNDGHRIGRFRPHKKDDVPDGTQTNIKIEHHDTEPREAAKQPEYILVVMNDDDAICVNYVAVTGPDNNQMAWYGDVGFSCGADWYHSQYKIGQNNYMPRCTWIDKKHSNGLRFVGMGIHITDFSSNSDALAQQVSGEKRILPIVWRVAKLFQYRDFPDSMCKTAPRFKMYENIGPDDVVPVYFPPLDLNTADNTDKEPAKISTNQGVKGGDPDLKILSKRQMNSSMPDTPAIPSNATLTRQTNEPGDRFDGHLIISHHEQHSAVELCEARFSIGPDFVSFHEEIFCDMYTKQTWPLCTDSVDDFRKNNATQASGDTMNVDKADEPSPGTGTMEPGATMASTETKDVDKNFTSSTVDVASSAIDKATPILPNKHPRSTDSAGATQSCFDIVKKVMRSAGPHRRDAANGQPIPDKSYDHSAHWH